MRGRRFGGRSSIGRAYRVLVSANILGNWMPRRERLVQVMQ